MLRARALYLPDSLIFFPEKIGGLERGVWTRACGGGGRRAALRRVRACARNWEGEEEEGPLRPFNYIFPVTKPKNYYVRVKCEIEAWEGVMGSHTPAWGHGPPARLPGPPTVIPTHMRE